MRPAPSSPTACTTSPPDPDTLVVVNCAGRTRSIIGCQSLSNAGIPNRVVALKDGTMGWDLAGFECERGATRVAPAPSAAGHGQGAARRPSACAQRFGVKFTTPRMIGRLAAAMSSRTTLSPRRAHARGIRGRPCRRLAPCAGRAARAGDRRVRRRAPRAGRARRSASACAP